MPLAEPVERIELFTVATPAGTTAAAPLTTALTFQDAEVLGVEIEIPPGHNGITGLRLVVGEQQVIPWTTGAWLVGDDRELAYPLAYLPTSGRWKARTYNTGRFSHSHIIRFLLRELVRPKGEGGAGLAPSLVGVQGVVTPEHA